MKSPTESHSKQSQPGSSVTQTHAPAVPGITPDEQDPEVTVLTPASSLTPEQYPSGITSRELAHALKGETLGHFLLQEFVGGGGMGVVFKAYDTRLDRTVAVKVVASHRISSDELERRFKVEAQSAARLDHPNIARVYEVNKTRGLPYIVFEYIDGVNLRDLVAQQGILSVTDALHYTYQLAHALSHATDRDVVHRDIKPSNILITSAGQTKLVDMGLARLQQIELDPEENDLTATGMTLGTFDYISPEQARDPRSADARSDIYSLGCTLFYMLAGQAPFANASMVEKLMQHQSETPPDLRSFRHDIPDSVNVLVRTMLAKSPSQRQQHPAQLAQQIRQILQELGSTVTHPLGPVDWNNTPPVSRLRTHLPWLIPLGVLLLFLLFIDDPRKSESAVSPFAPLRETKQQQVIQGSSVPAVSEEPLRLNQSLATTSDTLDAAEPIGLGSSSEDPAAGEAEAAIPNSMESNQPPSILFDPASISIVDESNTETDEETISPITNFDLIAPQERSAEGIEFNQRQEFQ